MAPTLMYSILFVLLAAVVWQGHLVQGQEDLNDLIAEIFNNNNKPTEPPVSVIPTQPVNNGPNTGHSYKSCGAGAECVRAYLCSNGKINNDGASLIDIRMEENPMCPTLEVCCSVGDKVDKPIIRPINPQPGCGYRNPNGVGFKIEGGTDNEAEFGEFPWMVAITRREMVRGKYINVFQCGGSLITPNVVLTGAHCVSGRPADIFTARAGEWETNSKSELFPDQDRKVAEIVVHDHYTTGSFYNNIALLFLESPFELAPNVNPVCLPPANMNFDHARCFATGWGKDKFENGRYQNILKKIELPVVPHDVCQNNLRNTRLGKYFELHSSFMCAGGEAGKDTCRGDGGSPLVCPIPNTPNRYYQAGIVAWGIGCGGLNVPGVYVNVPKLRAWIDEELAYKRVDSSFFTA